MSSEDSCESASGRWFDPVGYVQSFYAALWRAIIRPPRSYYTTDSMGPVKFRLNLPRLEADGDGCSPGAQCAGETCMARTFVRKDLRLKNSLGLDLECSHFCPANDEGTTKRPCVIYLHGNSSCRMESYAVMPLLLRFSLTLFTFDFAGSGLSDGDFVTLGHYEEQDLRLVIDYLRTQEDVGSIGLWGRSMGAVTAILRTSADSSSIAACVLDSPFSDFQSLVFDVAHAHSEKLPRWLVEMCLGMACKEVKERAGFDPRDLVPAERASLCKCPALFGVAAQDCLVRPERSEAVHRAWRGESSLRKFDGSHGSKRPQWFVAEAACFLAEKLALADEVDSQLTHASDVYFNSDECEQYRRMATRSKAVQRILESTQISSAVDAYIRCERIGSAIDTYLDEGSNARAEWLWCKGRK